MENVSDLNTAKDYLAKLLLNDGRISEADGVLAEAQLAYDKSGAPPAWIKAELLNDLGVIRDRQRRYEEAVALDEETVEVIEKKFGEDSLVLVAPLNNLATMFTRLNRFEEADGIYERAVRLCERTLGANHLTYGELLRNRAVVLKKLGKKRASKVLMAKAEEIISGSNRRNGIGATVNSAGLQAQK